MKLRKLVLLPAAAAAIAFGTPAIANSLTFQNVTFQTVGLDSDTLQLSILNATNATGDWTGVDFLKAFEIKDIGNVTGANITSGPAGTYTQTVDAVWLHPLDALPVVPMAPVSPPLHRSH